jgi:hypothetical protein
VERPFQRQVDEAGDLVTIPDRDLAGDQRRNADGLERREEVADPPVRLVDAVDEDDVRNALLVESPQRRRPPSCARCNRLFPDDSQFG